MTRSNTESVSWCEHPMDGARFRWGRCHDGFVGEWEGIMRVRVDATGRLTEIVSAPGVEQSLVRKLSEGPAQAFARSVVGKLSLHASAVTCNGGAVLCVGASGAGKSTAAAVLCKLAGGALLSDDMAAVEPIDGDWSALPTESVHWLHAGGGMNQKRMVVPKDVSDRPTSVRCIVALSIEEGLPDATWRRLRGAEAFRALMTSPARLTLSDAARRRELDLLASLCMQVTVVELKRPRLMRAGTIGEPHHGDSPWERSRANRDVFVSARGEMYLVVAPHVHARDFDGELVVVDLRDGAYFALNPVATCMWNELAKGRSPEETARTLEPEFLVETEELVRDCRELALELLRRGLMQRKSP